MKAMEAKLKHLEFIQAAISRMATNSFLFKGWAITIAAGLSAFGTANMQAGLLTIALVSTVMFWAIDAYYLCSSAVSEIFIRKSRLATKPVSIFPWRSIKLVRRGSGSKHVGAAIWFSSTAQ